MPITLSSLLLLAPTPGGTTVPVHTKAVTHSTIRQRTVRQLGADQFVIVDRNDTAPKSLIAETAQLGATIGIDQILVNGRDSRFSGTGR